MTKKNMKLVAGMALGAALVLPGTSAKADQDGQLMHGFADAGWGMGGANAPARKRQRSFFVGSLDLYINPDLGQNVKFLSEVNIDPGTSDGAVAVDTERLQVGYVFNNHLTGWVGRFHTPIGFWNTAYHHGAQLQTSVYKPKFIDFEDKYGVLPVHTVGLWLTGSTAVGSGKVGYDFYIGNGSHITSDTTAWGSTFQTTEMNIISDDNDNMAVGGKLSYSFTGGSLDGLVVGAHYLQEQVPVDSGATDHSGTAATGTIDFQTIGGYVVYDANNVEFISEFYQFSNKDALTTGATAQKSHAYFAQLGYMFGESLIPFARYEKAAFNQADPYFALQTNGGSYTRQAVGFRYNLSEKTCVKVEGLHTDVTDVNPGNTGGAYDEIRTQYAIRF